jgi:hypothetical protein
MPRRRQMEINLPQTHLAVTRRGEKNKAEVLYEVLEMEVPMTAQQQDAYGQIVGDGNAKVTISREVSENNYGSGGKVFVAISLTCHQGQEYINTAVTMAKQLADYYAELHWNELKGKLVQMGIIAPQRTP